MQAFIVVREHLQSLAEKAFEQARRTPRDQIPVEEVERQAFAQALVEGVMPAEPIITLKHLEVDADENTWTFTLVYQVEHGELLQYRSDELQNLELEFKPGEMSSSFSMRKRQADLKNYVEAQKNLVQKYVLSVAQARQTVIAQLVLEVRKLLSYREHALTAAAEVLADFGVGVFLKSPQT